MSDQDIDTRTDIYSLGVVALRAFHRPDALRLERAAPVTVSRRSAAAFAKTIRLPPSARVSTPGTGHPGDHPAAHQQRQQAGAGSARRPGLDHHEGHGEGPHPPLRLAQGTGRRSAPAPEQRAGAGQPAECVLSHPEIRAAAYGGGGLCRAHDGDADRLCGHDDRAGRTHRHRARPGQRRGGDRAARFRSSW